jgi:hypothetical protein
MKMGDVHNADLFVMCSFEERELWSLAAISVVRIFIPAQA